MDFLKACRTDELDDDKPHGVRVLAREILLLQREGAVVALEGNCKHQHAPLAGGACENGHIVCPRHGWRYDLVTGRCLDPDWAVLRRYQVKIEDGHVWVGTTPLPED